MNAIRLRNPHHIEETSLQDSVAASEFKNIKTTDDDDVLLLNANQMTIHLKKRCIMDIIQHIYGIDTSMAFINSLYACCPNAPCTPFFTTHYSYGIRNTWCYYIIFIYKIFLPVESHNLLPLVTDDLHCMVTLTMAATTYLLYRVF